MRIRPKATAIIVASAACIASAQVVMVQSDLGPEQIQLAVDIGRKGNVEAPSIRAFRRGGIGRIGQPDIGSATTPWVRVALFAKEAARTYRTVTVADIPKELLAPELQIYVWPQRAGDQTLGFATVQAIVITPKKGSDEEKRANALQPLRFDVVPASFQNLFGARFNAEGRLAVFPLTALSNEHEIRIVFDRPIDIGSGVSGCRDCRMPIDKIEGLR